MGSAPAMGRLTPLTASTDPNATVRFWEEAGSKPGGVNAVTAPASATVMNEDFIILISS
jgi:hypothetical protein